MEEQKDIVSGSGDLGGTMRLGLYPANLADGSIVRGLYGAPSVQERHRHRYEVNNAYRDKLETAGLVFSGTVAGQRAGRVHRAARSLHPYFVATQAHPELRSRPTKPHPLFSGLIAAALVRQRESRLPVEEPAVAKKAAGRQDRGRRLDEGPPGTAIRCRSGRRP